MKKLLRYAPERGKSGSCGAGVMYMRALYRLIKFVLLAAVFLCVFLAGGIFLFVQAIERDAETPQAAEGIVALTGGRERIGQAYKLLANGQAKRLLITGVHEDTRAQDLQRLVPRGEEFFPCCVDLGRAALDTRGNADETSAWVKKHGFSSLIVVTSSYHMPRTLVQFARSMPQVQLIPYPVVTPNFQIERWWAHDGTRRLLVTEYIKYLKALAEFGGARLAQGVGLSAPAGTPAEAN